MRFEEKPSILSDRINSQGLLTKGYLRRRIASQAGPPRDSSSERSSLVDALLDLFLTVYSSIFLQNRGLRNHRGGVAPGAVSLPGADGSTC